MRSTIPGAAGITETHLHGFDLFYVGPALATVLKIPMSLATWLPTGPSILITDGTLINDLTLS